MAAAYLVDKGYPRLWKYVHEHQARLQSVCTWFWDEFDLDDDAQSAAKAEHLSGYTGMLIKYLQRFEGQHWSRIVAELIDKNDLHKYIYAFIDILMWLRKVMVSYEWHQRTQNHYHHHQ